MLAFLTGKIIQKNKNSIVVMTSGGVGYLVRLQVCKCASLQVDSEISLYTYLKVSETSMDVYGFEELAEKRFFELLISVKGIGPKGALNILGLGSIDEIQDAIGRGDVKYLTQVSGLGKRTAERMCVELKSKVEHRNLNILDNESNHNNLAEVVDALVSMGYGKDEVRDVVKQFDSEGKSTEELLKMALKYLSNSA